MTKMVALFLYCIVVFLPSQASANELIVVSGDSSKNSKRWKDEVFREPAGFKAKGATDTRAYRHRCGSCSAKARRYRDL